MKSERDYNLGNDQPETNDQFNTTNDPGADTGAGQEENNDGKKEGRLNSGRKQKFSSKKTGSYNKPEEEEETDEDMEEGEEEGTVDMKGKVDEIAKKVMQYIKENTETVDKKALVKYASLAVLSLYGMRKSGLLGGLLVTAAVGVLAKHLLTEGLQQESEKEAA